MSIAEELHETKIKHARLSTDEVHAHEHIHITPFWPMFIVFAVLCILTVITVVTAKFINLPGSGNLLLAMFIACFKAMLVAAWFMHLKYDNKMNAAVVVASLFGVVLFIGFTMLDLSSRAIADPLNDGEILYGGSQQIVATAIENAHQADHNEDAAHTDTHMEHGEEKEFVEEADGLSHDEPVEPDDHD